MPALETSRTTQSTLGRSYQQEENFSAGSSSTNRGAQSNSRSEQRPLITSTETTNAPEIAATRASRVHVGIDFQFTLSFKGRARKE